MDMDEMAKEAIDSLTKENAALRSKLKVAVEALRFIKEYCSCNELCSCSDIMKEKATESLAQIAEEG